MEFFSTFIRQWQWLDWAMKAQKRQWVSEILILVLNSTKQNHAMHFYFKIRTPKTTGLAEIR